MRSSRRSASSCSGGVAGWRTCKTVLGAGQALSGPRDHGRARRPGARSASVPARRTTRGAADRHRAANRDHARGGAALALRPRGLAVSQPCPTISLIFMPGPAATPATGLWASTRPARPSAETFDPGYEPRARSLRRASRSDRPMTFGTTPCSGFASTRVTQSWDGAPALAGELVQHEVDALLGPRGFVDGLAEAQRLQGEPLRRPCQRHSDDAWNVDLVGLQSALRCGPRPEKYETVRYRGSGRCRAATLRRARRLVSPTRTHSLRRE